MSTRTSFLGRQIAQTQNLWRYRELVTSLAARNLKVKYKRSVLGFVWTLINPLLTVTILIGVFTYIVRIPLERYWAFLLSGYFVWNFLMQTLNSATYVLAEHGQLSRAVAFPKATPILAAALSRLIEFSIELALVVIVLTIFHHGSLPVSFLVLPLLVIIQVVMALGLAFPIATLSVFYHDVQHALPILLTTLFYISPVFYPANLVPESVRPLYMANPLAQLLTLYHAALYSGKMPTLAAVVSVSVIAIVLLVIGYGIFNRYERFFAEVV
jgi:ABC-type polysaccharide/polyol phosphate export permease